MHAGMTTAADILRGVPREKLNSPVTDIHIQEVASELKKWEELALHLSLTVAEEEEIRVDYQGRYGLQKREVLRKWQQKLGKHGATYRALIVALCCAQQNEMAGKVKHLLSKPDKPDASSHILETFRGYLVDCYAEMPHPSHTQWPFSQMSSYVNLSLFEAPLDEELPHTSGTDEQEKGKPKPLKEVKLENLFHVRRSHQAKRKVVLIEGPAGCGKTTLSWHACREWAAGRLFQEFSLLIHVSLEDPAVHEARCLADLIPCESNEMREAVAKAIFERRGKGVCFLFDAWDEAPRTLHHVTSFLYKFITGASTRMLPRCSIVITSRPVVAALLYPNLTTRVTIEEFNSTNVEKFIDISLDHNSDTKQRLLQALHASPELTSLCSLPINAAIVVHVFQSLNYKLPSTRTGLFHALVCNLLLRHMQLRTDYGLQKLEVFESLPDDIFQQFKAVCALAYHGIIEDRRLFELSAHPTSSLGLMQMHQQLTCYGPSHHYSFLHYAVQEFLAAYHISQCSEEEQTKAIGEILHSTPLSLVLPFYAGLTELATKNARNILLKVTKFPLDEVTVICDKSCNTSADKRMLLLALLNCIYESQNPALCRLVNPPTNPEYLEQCYPAEALSDTSMQQYLIKLFGIILTLTQLKLTPADCLSIGYFILNFNKRITINLRCCYVSEAAVESLMKQLRKPCYNEPGHISIVLNNNILTDKAVQCISNTLVQTSALVRLDLGSCFVFDTSSDIRVFLKYIIEGTSRNSTLEYLALSNCGLGPEHCYHLALMIAVSNIQCLSLSGNNIGSVIHLIVSATMHSKIEQLHLSGCCISDQELHSIGIALQGNVPLGTLYIEGNLFSSPSLTKFLQLLIFNFGLRFLGLKCSLTDEQKDIVKEINRTRQIWKVGNKFCTFDVTPMDQKSATFFNCLDSGLCHEFYKCHVK